MNSYDASSILAYSPRKSRLIINAIRGKKLSQALEDLTVINKGQTKQIYKLLLNAANNKKIPESSFGQYRIDEIVAEEAQKLYRVVPRARGTAFRIRRRYSRIKVALNPIN